MTTDTIQMIHCCPKCDTVYPDANDVPAVCDNCPGVPVERKRHDISGAVSTGSAATASVPGAYSAEPKLCSYCGIVIDSGMVCTTESEFNHCPAHLLLDAPDGVEGSAK